MTFLIDITEGRFMGPESMWWPTPGTGDYRCYLRNYERHPAGDYEFGFICKKEKIGEFILDGMQKIKDKLEAKP